VKLARVLAKLSEQTLTAWAAEQGYRRYVGPTSLKRTAEINWSDAAERRRFLGEIVADADRLLEQARAARSELDAGSATEATLVEAAGLLSRVLVQDVERREDGPAIKQGVARDRLLSVHDPEMRLGRKSASKRFDGYKAAVVVDTDEPLITAVAVLAGNAPAAERARELVEQTEANTGCAVDETMGDGAYGSGETRQAFAEAGRTLVAKVPATTNQGCFPKTALCSTSTPPAPPVRPGRPLRTSRRARPVAGSSASRRRSTPPAHSVPRASAASVGGRSPCIPRNGCSRQPAPCRPARRSPSTDADASGSSTASPDWSSWASARPATSGRPRSGSSC